MKRFYSVLLIIALTVTMLMGAAGTSFAASVDDIDKVFTDVADSLYETMGDPGVDDIWTLYGLTMAGYPVSDSDIDKFKTDLEEFVKSKDGKLTITTRNYGDGNIVEIDSKQYSDYSKFVIICNDLGIDPTDVAGYNLVDPLADITKVGAQGINGPIWAMIALDGCGYCFSREAIVAAGNDLTTKKKMIDAFLKAQLDDGGWAWIGDKADPDITGMVVRALASHKGERSDLDKALERAEEAMSNMQLENGDFATIMETGADPTATSESTSQIICALALLGIDPNTDEDFIKNGNTAIDGLLSYYVDGELGFKHIDANPKANPLATCQGFYALAHYYKNIVNKHYYQLLADKAEVTPAYEDLAAKAADEETNIAAREGKKAELLKSLTAKAKEEAKAAKSIKAKNKKIIKGIKAETIKLKAKRIKKSGTYKVKLSWKRSGSYKVDSYQIFRSLKKSSGYGTKAYATAKKNAKKLTVSKKLKAGKKYYFRMRGVRKVNGKKYYTKWSNKVSVKIPKE